MKVWSQLASDKKNPVKSYIPSTSVFFWWPLGAIGCGMGMEGVVVTLRTSKTVFTEMRTPVQQRKREMGSQSLNLGPVFLLISCFLSFFSHVQELLHKEANLNKRNSDVY